MLLKKHALTACCNQKTKETNCVRLKAGLSWLCELVTDITSLAGLFRIVTSGQLRTEECAAPEECELQPEPPPPVQY